MKITHPHTFVKPGQIGITTTSGRVVAGPKWQATDPWSAMQQRLSADAPPAHVRAKNFGPTGAAAYAGLSRNAPSTRTTTTSNTATRQLMSSDNAPLRTFTESMLRGFPTRIDWTALFEGPTRIIDRELDHIGYTAGFIGELHAALEQARIDSPHMILAALAQGVFPGLWDMPMINSGAQYPAPATRPLTMTLLYQQYMQPLGLYLGGAPTSKSSKSYAGYLFGHLQSVMWALSEGNIVPAEHISEDDAPLLQVTLYETHDRFRADSYNGGGMGMTEGFTLRRMASRIMGGTNSLGTHFTLLAMAFDSANYRMAAHMGAIFSETHPEIDPESMFARLAASMDYIYALYHGGHRAAQDSLQWIDHFRSNTLLRPFDDGFLGIPDIQAYLLAVKDQAQDLQESDMLETIMHILPGSGDMVNSMRSAEPHITRVISDLEALPRTFARERLYARAESASEDYFELVQLLGAGHTERALMQYGSLATSLLGLDFLTDATDALADGNIAALLTPDNAKRAQDAMVAFGHIVHTRSAVAQGTIRNINLRRLRRPGMRMPEISPQEQVALAHASQGLQQAIPHLMSITSNPAAHLGALRDVQRTMIAPLRAQYPLRQPHNTPSIAHYIYALHLHFEIAAQLAEGELRTATLLN